MQTVGNDLEARLESYYGHNAPRTLFPAVQSLFFVIIAPLKALLPYHVRLPHPDFFAGTLTTITKVFVASIATPVGFLNDATKAYPSECPKLDGGLMVDDTYPATVVTT